MIHVWSLCWGDKYKRQHVERLRFQVHQRLQQEHRFRVISDRSDLPWAYRPLNDYPGWWGKINLFDQSYNGEPVVNLWLDLDVHLISDLKPLIDVVDRPGVIHAAANWAESGHGGIQSSVMSWIPSQELQIVADEFPPEMAIWPPQHNPPKQLWGDQEWLGVLHERGKINWTPYPAQYVRSYKYHVLRGKSLQSTVAISFHGNPKPWEVGL